MNANELADELVDLIVAPTPVDDKWACELIDKAATMLRQQKTEIEKLKDEVAEWKMYYENCHRMCNGYGMN